MKANYSTGGFRFWFEADIHHNNCKQCRFSNGCTDKNKHNSDKCSKFKPKVSKKRRKK